MYKFEVPLHFGILQWMVSIGLANSSLTLQLMCFKAMNDHSFKRCLKGITTGKHSHYRLVEADELIAKFPAPPPYHRKLMNSWQRLKKLCEDEVNVKYREAEALVERVVFSLLKTYF